MNKYILRANVSACRGFQYYTVEAESSDEALKKWETEGGEFLMEEIEVMELDHDSCTIKLYDESEHGFYDELSHLRAENERLTSRVAELEKDAKRLLGLRRLCGYVEDGSDTVIKILQDDATKSWSVHVGKSQVAYADSFTGAIDAAIASQLNVPGNQ